MPSARDPSPLDLRQHHGVETPEHVEVRLELAGVGSRMAAAILDSILLYLSLLLLALVGGNVFGAGLGAAGSWFLAVIILLFYGLVWGYFAAFEAWNGGRTPGKQALGIRVVMDTGRPVTVGAAVVRNLVRLLDCYFPFLPILPALLLMFINKSNKRLGDMAAGTIVVRDRPTDWVLGAVTAPAPGDREELETGPPELSEDEFRLLDRFLARMNDLDAAVQVRMTTDPSRQFGCHPDLHGRIEVVHPREEAVQQAELVLGQLGGAGFELLALAGGGCGHRPESPVGGPVAHHDRSGGHVPQPLVALVDEHQEQRRQNRQEREVAVEQAHEVADDGRPDGHRPAGVHHDADAERLLSGRATAVPRLEGGEIAPHQPIEQEDDDRQEPRSGGAETGAEHVAADQGEQQQRQVEQDRVEDCRRHARADARQLQTHLDVLGRLDAVVLAKVEW